MNFNKSAVFFAIIFGLNACDDNPKQTETSPVSLELLQQQVIAQQKILQEQEQRRLTRGVYSDLTLNLLQANNAEQMTFLRDLLEGLVIYDRNGNIVPAVAEKWQSEDNKTWIFILRPNIKWSNGEALTAHDFVRAWQQLALSDSKLKHYLQFINLANSQAVLEKTLPVEQLGVHALNDHTLQIQLDKSTPYLPKMLAHVALLPRYGEPVQKFVGNGAYQLKSQNGNIIQLEKNLHYWNNAAVAFSEVQYQKITTQQALTNIDWVDNPLVTQSKSAVNFPQLCTYFYEFNFKDPMLKESAVRKALVSMISPISIVQNENINARANGSYLPKNLQFEDERSWAPTVLEQLFTSFNISETNPLKLRLTYDNTAPHSDIANRLIRAWSQSDLLRIEADPQPRTKILEKRMKGDFQLIRSGWCADYNDPSAFLNLAYSKSPDNKTGYNNPDIDKLLEQSLDKKITEEKRTALYQQIYQILRDDVVVLPIFQYMKPVHIKSNLKGYNVENPTEVIYSKDLWRDR
ncbi:peptide/nickel transport system substrate-binding protein [Cricetibacter osteomyelitidis]|uniref:Peptide/nickel transport system substrate-binding protein n=1 Tax=Cricetibacter osteomyelitidis TaxID=1521931 RepID=A0A4R2SKW5_9PAST|nr:peptide ABC transporter substrate-binding protein [Cricetibacter osteomyelitidis]TCP89760.1 peptide/nickel transport system substrate-binding protein [Cricetibacter osteomyelitidis]